VFIQAVCRPTYGRDNSFRPILLFVWVVYDANADDRERMASDRPIRFRSFAEGRKPGWEVIGFANVPRDPNVSALGANLCQARESESRGTTPHDCLVCVLSHKAASACVGELAVRGLHRELAREEAEYEGH
jgi:hypothetical protein